MLRKLIKDGIRRVQKNQDPKGIIRKSTGVIPTYSHNTVINVKPAPTPEADRQLLRDTGRRALEEYIKMKGC
jgi:hypothetical protein